MRGDEALRNREQEDHQVEHMLKALEQQQYLMCLWHQQMKVKGHQSDQGLHHQLALSIHQ
jgi:hypothetical protein